MKRSIENWTLCNPKPMARMSEAAILHALVDAKSDIIELYNETRRLRSVLRMVAYPRRGTSEEALGMLDMAKLIQSTYTAEELSQ